MKDRWNISALRLPAGIGQFACSSVCRRRTALVSCTPWAKGIGQVSWSLFTCHENIWKWGVDTICWKLLKYVETPECWNIVNIWHLVNSWQICGKTWWVSGSSPRFCAGVWRLLPGFQKSRHGFLHGLGFDGLKKNRWSCKMCGDSSASNSSLERQPHEALFIPNKTILVE